MVIISKLIIIFLSWPITYKWLILKFSNILYLYKFKTLKRKIFYLFRHHIFVLSIMKNISLKNLVKLELVKNNLLLTTSDTYIIKMSKYEKGPYTMIYLILTDTHKLKKKL